MSFVTIELNRMMIVRLLFMVLVTYSCSTSESHLYEFDPRTLVENKISLADIADDIEYIHLDNTLPLGNIYTYRLIDSSIYLSTKDIGIMEFNRDGKFIRKIGALGRGPGEYHYFWFFDIDPQTKSVYVLDFNMIKVYSGSGHFQRSISLKEFDQDYFDNISFFNEKLLITNDIHRGQSKYSWIILDTNGILIKQKYNPIPTFNSTLESKEGTYLFDNKIFYWEWYNDTVYSILPDLSYKASFLFSPGEHRWPKSMIQISATEAFISLLTNHMQIKLIFETDRFLVIAYGYKKNFIAMIDKKSKKSYLTTLVQDNNGQTHGGIFNNIDGGIGFQPERYFVENNREYIIALVDPSELKTHIESNEFAEVAPKYPEKKEKLKELSKSIKETDNPILMLVKLKK